ncbi:hypothetical protein [Streptomyces sp. NPDC017520]|uniref:hypothetical protein n=1 Tax=Streptomyces sp. NPDC017520 TaxID=3364998 RepID=UPI0037B3EEE8
MLAKVVNGPGRLLAEYELYLLAARRPELRGSTRHWLEAIAAYGRRYTDDPVRVRALKGVIDGLLLQGLLTDTPPTAAEFEAVLRHVLLRLRAPAPSASATGRGPPSVPPRDGP